METLETLQAQLAELNSKIATIKATKTPAAKIKRRLDNMKLCHKTAHKYYSLQELYMNTILGK
jgi:outer membrane murein-binding lipoprotein Lpp